MRLEFALEYADILIILITAETTEDKGKSDALVRSVFR